MPEVAISEHADIADKRLVRRLSCIGGAWRPAASGATFPVSDPATGKVIGEVARLSSDRSRGAADAAQKPFGGWSASPPQDRAGVLRKWRDLILDHREDLARIMAPEQRKPLSGARGEIDYGAGFGAGAGRPRRAGRLSARRFQRRDRAPRNGGRPLVNRTGATGAPIPFGGVRQSGLGREGARAGMQEFMELKYVCRDWAQT